MQDLALIAVALVGMALHWTKRRAMEQTASGFFEYFFVNDLLHTLGALSVCLIASISYLMGFNGEIGRADVYTMILTGYSADSFNRG